MNPQLVDTGKVYSIKPEDRKGDFTFTRSSYATRVNADGNIEKETQNLLLQSNTFDTNWAKTNASVTSGQSGYDGTNDAWQITATATSSSFVRQFINVTSQVSTFSVYAKAGNVDWAYLNCVGVTAYYDLTNGVVGTTTGGGNLIDTKIVSVGNGWWKISITGLGIEQQRIYVANGNLGFDTAIGEYIYIQDAQLEQGLVARDYIETTTAAVYGGITDNTPRLDYTDSSCPALLLEPQRTNLIPNSEYIPATFFPINSNLTANSGISPEGVQNSTAVNVISLSNGYCYYVPAVTDGVTYKFSAYYKGTAGESISMRTINSFTGDITSNTFTLTGNWQREEVNLTAGPSNNLVYLYDGRVGGLTATDFEIYGAQLEAGSYATSYIPTYGSSVTRNVDVSSVSSMISNGIINDEKFTFMMHLKILGRATNPQVYLTDVSGNRIVSLNTQSLNKASFYSPDAANYIGNGTFIGDSVKAAISYDGNKFVQYINGAKDGTLSVNITSLLNGINLNNNILNAIDVKQVLVFPTALTDQEAIDLTTI